MKHLKKIIAASISVLGITALSTSALSNIGLNFRPLSSLDEPLAIEVFEHSTLVLRGLIDVPIGYSIVNDQDANLGPVANVEIGLETTLNNRWDVGISYFGQYDEADPDENYSDNVALFIGGAWGTVAAGNIDGLVREETRRARGVGNGFLSFDDHYGGLNEWGGGYVGRFGPAKLSAVIDDDANYDLGISFQRPLGNKDYRFTARHSSGTFETVGGLNTVDTKAISAVAELVYGSTRFDIGGGYEKLSLDDTDADRWYSSAGITTKAGVWSLSVEGHYGEVEKQTERAFAIGIQRDLARGLSANLGVNREDAQININGIDYVNIKDTQLIASLRYSF